MSERRVSPENTCPSEFFLWWLDRAREHGLASEYAQLYRAYWVQPERLTYVWEHYDQRLRHLSARATPGLRVLDVGCGLATELLWLAMKGCTVVGVDMHGRSLRVARLRQRLLERELGRSLSCEIRELNLFDVPTAEQYDVVWLKEAFHHIEPRERAVEKLVSLLAAGGELIIEEVNALNPLLQLQFYRIRGLNTVVTKRDSETGLEYLYGNERIVTARGIDRLFRRFSLESRVEHFRLLPTRLARTRLHKAARWIERAFGDARWLRPFFIHYIWIGKRP